MYTNSSDCYFYVVGSSDSNELVLGTVLDTLLDSVGTLLKESIDKHSLLNNLELILLVMDEIIDNGIIFELDPYKVANRVLMIVRSLSFSLTYFSLCVYVCVFLCKYSMINFVRFLQTQDNEEDREGVNSGF